MGLRLNTKTEPYWLELDYGVAHKVRPLSSAMTASIRAKADRLAKSMLEADEAERLAGLIDDEDLTEKEIVDGLSEMYFAILLAQAATIEWRGWFDGKDESGRDKPVPLSDEALAAAMRQPFMARLFLGKYFMPYGEVIEEGNG
ncbi:hypothetical protein [Parvibaculum sp.]|uniref:hypothetical protein n=1 Tax=Parvibaculum sp. TaxID=2024848 RepID=UPI000C3B4EE6|nr:hypothetical protein [Parvibaculum sp.]MAM95676.1 hypothetical protein [Parvibaculum sp.]HCX68953.1 hypothetical protein [Rhodobiaceae bacterium]|tara:strand:- start:7547 stop:7978 length:432 start_codon:yes stop_codon:yes gene_type:complete